ncbi:MAG: hypothetical protein ACRDSJ_09225, partial [Rubrobacteraceae bacterium]
PRVASWLAWSVAGLSIAMFVGGVLLLFLALFIGDAPASGVVGGLVIYVPYLAFPIVGALVASKRPGNAIGWICLAVGLFWMFIELVEAHNAYEIARFGQDRFSVTFEALLFQWFWVPPVGLLGVYMFLLFPDGRLPSRRWRPFAWFAGAVMALICVGSVFIPGPLLHRPGVRNPFGLEALAWSANVLVFIILMLLVCILVSALSLVFRYRRAGGEMRQQIKWLAFAACFVGLFFSIGLLPQIFLAPESGAAPEPLWVSLMNNLRLVSFAGVPVAVGVAILRYRLYDIEIIINRALVYGSLTAMLALIYFGSVVVLQRTFVFLTGEGSQLTIVASTLAIAALFHPLRRRVQAFVDRRFYRKKYDAARVLDAFSSKLRDEADLDQLNGDLVAVVRETVQPAHVSLWLREPRRDGET